MKMALSVSTLSLCYPVNEVVSWLRRWFNGTGSGEARKGFVERNVRWAPFARTLCGMCLKIRKKITFSQSGK
jgi:hypothetical protein